MLLVSVLPLLQVHILDGVHPFGDWWQETLKIGSVKVYPFRKDQVPASLNGHPVTKPAHLSDFWRFQVLAKEGGVYMDTDHIILHSMDELFHYSSVWGRQAANEFGYQVAIGFFLTEPNNPTLTTLLARMRKRFDGSWASHSIVNVDDYFNKNRPAGCLVLPYGALFPFSWKRGDLCCDYWYHNGTDVTSLTDGKGFDWTGIYSTHLFHSQSGSFLQRFEPYQLKEKTNLVNAIRLALGEEGTKLLGKLMNK